VAWLFYDDPESTIIQVYRHESADLTSKNFGLHKSPLAPHIETDALPDWESSRKTDYKQYDRDRYPR
jgi:hypothetical protein